MSTRLTGFQSSRNENPSWLPPHLLLLMKAPGPGEFAVGAVLDDIAIGEPEQAELAQVRVLRCRISIVARDEAPVRPSPAEVPAGGCASIDPSDRVCGRLRRVRPLRIILQLFRLPGDFRDLAPGCSPLVKNFTLRPAAALGVARNYSCRRAFYWTAEGTSDV